MRIEKGKLNGSQCLGTGELRFDDVKAIYARPMDDTQLPELQNEPTTSQRFNHCRALHELLIRWMEIAPGRVINRPSAMA